MPKQPKYQEIYNYFRDQIINEYIKPDSPLPQEPEIIQQFSTSHMTINKAMTQLSVDGYIRRVPGTGSFACDDYKKKFQSSQDNLQSINDIIISNGMVPHTVVVSYQVKKGSELPEQSALLNIKPNEYIHEIVRIKYANDRLLCYTVARLSQKMVMKEVQYKSAEELESYVVETKKDCAFIKSKPFKPEKEIRIVTYQSETGENEKIVDYLSGLMSGTIKSIRFSPFLDQEMYCLIKELLRKYLKANNWAKTKISQSEILNKEKWQNALCKCVGSIAQK